MHTNKARTVAELTFRGRIRIKSICEYAKMSITCTRKIHDFSFYCPYMK